jgi:cytochrome c-type biogenesis protein CcmH/NrfG
MRAEVERRTVALAAPEPVDEQTRRQLAALGYIGSAAAPAGARLPDPKSMIHTLKPLQDGLELFGQQKPAEAARALRQAVDANPLMVDAWSYLGFSYQRLQEHERALAAFREATRLSGGLPEVALATAATLAELGRVDEARLVLQHQIARSPEDFRLRYQEVRLLLFSGRLEEAAAAAESTLQLAPEEADAQYQMGSVRMAQRSLPEAERHLRRALELDAAHPAALSDLAVLLAATGRPDEAAALLERLVASRPDDALARQNLERIRTQARRGGR